MTTNLRRTATATPSLTVLLACGLLACTSQETNPGTGGTTGNGGSAPGGSTGSGGSAGGSSGSSTPAACTDATFTATGSDGTLCPAPAALISDFTAWDATVGFGATGALQGNVWVSPTTLKSDLSQNNWHISGSVDNYDSFGLYFNACNRIDASKYKGISFSVSGTVEQGGIITLNVGTLNDTATWSWMLCNGKTTASSSDSGRCRPSQNTANQYYSPGCVPPSKDIPVSATPTTVTVLWADLLKGMPDATVSPANLTSIAWAFPNPTGVGTATVKPYAIDIVIDDLKFVE